MEFVFSFFTYFAPLFLLRKGGWRMPYEPAKVVRPASFLPSGFNKFCFTGRPALFQMIVYQYMVSRLQSGFYIRRQFPDGLRFLCAVRSGGGEAGCDPVFMVTDRRKHKERSAGTVVVNFLGYRIVNVIFYFPFIVNIAR